MSRLGITYQEVALAAVAVQGKGETPTIDKVRTELGGTGSNSTISKYLNQWRQKGSPLALEQVQPPPDVVQAAVEQVWLQMREKTETDIEAIKTQAQYLVEAAEERAQKAEAELTNLKRDYEESQQSYHRLSGEKEILALDMNSLSKEHELLQARFQTMTARHEELQLTHSRELEDRERLHQKELSRLEEKSKQLIDRCERMVAEARKSAEAERAQSNELIDIVKKELTTATAKIESLQDELNKVSVLIAELQIAKSVLTTERDCALANLISTQEKLEMQEQHYQKTQQLLAEKWDALQQSFKVESIEIEKTLDSNKQTMIEQIQNQLLQMEAKFLTLLEQTHKENLSIVK